MTVRSAVAGVALSMAIVGSVAAQTILSPPKNVIEVRPGGQTVVKMPKPFSSISVGDPEVVDVLPRSDNVMVFLGRKPGTADVIVFSDADPVFHVTVTVGAPHNSSRVVSHGKKELHQYYAYECKPVCVRVKDELEGPPALAPIVVQGGSAGASSSINVIVPPQAPAR